MHKKLKYYYSSIEYFDLKVVNNECSTAVAYFKKYDTKHILIEKYMLAIRATKRNLYLKAFNRSNLLFLLNSNYE